MHTHFRNLQDIWTGAYLETRKSSSHFLSALSAYLLHAYTEILCLFVHKIGSRNCHHLQGYVLLSKEPPHWCSELSHFHMSQGSLSSVTCHWRAGYKQSCADHLAGYRRTRVSSSKELLGGHALPTIVKNFSKFVSKVQCIRIPVCTF